tara:strand:+ start:1549 stop:2613 length:1065 start_codon:yes stop_codon:yes gene_type:complete
MKTIMHIVGTRPNYVKASPVINSIVDYKQVVLNTGQHYDDCLSKNIIDSLDMRKPDINLNLPIFDNSFKRFSFLLSVIAENMISINPSMVVLYGDVDSTLAAALVASRLHMPIAHVESGLRSFDNRMPEEVNRKIVDKISSLHFVTEESGINNLNSEGFSDSIHLVGNTMIDSLIKVIHSEKYRKLNINNTNNILLTCHRPSNVDNKNSLQKIFDMCYKIERKITWPLHPRTKNRMIEHNLLTRFESLQNLDLINPLEYCKFLKYMATSYAVITDSGGIQEETTYLKVPCLTIRKNTERPITITTGTNRLVSIKQVTNSFEKLVEDTKGSRVPIMWDGYAAQRISKVISNFMEI